MANRYNIKDNDRPYTRICKTEANIYLASLNSSNDTERLEAEKACDDLLSLTNTLDKLYNKGVDNKLNILNKLNRLVKYNILTPLTLSDDEFITINGSVRNSRFKHIYKVEDTIYNEWAFNILVRKEYDDEFEIEIKKTPELKECNHIVYISKGGIITGEYIKDCIIRPELKGRFTIQSIPNIPVSAIRYKKEDGVYDVFYAVDHREPKLKVLQEFYEVPIYTDEYIKGKFNIRKYQKLK